MRAVQLRGWQREAFALYESQLQAGGKRSLWEATPGAGKTTAALQVVRHQLETARARTALIVVPTSHLRVQWARSALRSGIQLDYAFGGTRRRITSDFNGAVVTYQQIANSVELFRDIAAESVVVLDEVHHVGDGLAWGQTIRQSFEGARYILCLSGTAFRSDSNPIPFVSYDEAGMSAPDFVYPYARAVQDGVCRPTAVFTYGGSVSWSEHQQIYQADFADGLDPVGAARRLRAALEPASGWIQPMLTDAHNMLLATRREHPKAGGLIVCADQGHAREVASAISAISGQKPSVVLSDDSGASKKIKQFSEDESLWIVACNMVSEGVDIPRLRVGVYATSTRTKLYFRQFVGRIVRRQAHLPGMQVAYLYVPADPALQYLAEEIETECKHSIRAKSVDLFGDDLRDDRERPEGKERSWTAVGGVNSGLNTVIVHGNQLALFESVGVVEEVRAVVEREVELHLEQGMTRTEAKMQLATEIQRIVGLIHRKTGKPHSVIHTTLNKAQRVRSQVHCTEKQLQERLEMAQKMLW